MTDDLTLTGPNKRFEDIKKTDENGIEYWTARELMSVLGYSNWQNFEEVVKKAKQACMSSGQTIGNHFIDVSKMVKIGSNTVRRIPDWKLDRYACYLIAQNGDPEKPQIALAQTYFAIQTRRQELVSQLEGSEKRLFIRGEVSEQNKKLFSTAKMAGVSRFGLFNDAGYRGLYGKSLAEIEKGKGIKKGELLDRAGSAELAANLFRITQTDEKLKKDNIRGEREATNTHNMVGGKVRQTIKDIGGVLPEELAPEKHIKELIRELKQLGAKEQKKLTEGVDDKYRSEEPLIIRIPPGTTVNLLTKLNKLLRSNPGLTQVILELPQGNQVRRLKLPYQVRLTKILLDDVKKMLSY